MHLVVGVLKKRKVKPDFAPVRFHIALLRVLVFGQFWTIEGIWTGRFKPIQKERFFPLCPKLANPVKWGYPLHSSIFSDEEVLYVDTISRLYV